MKCKTWHFPLMQPSNLIVFLVNWNNFFIFFLVYGRTGTGSISSANAISLDTGPPQKLTVRRILSVVVSVYCNFTEASCVALLAPFFPVICEEKGVPPVVYGIIFATLQAVMLITCPLFGKWVSFFLQTTPSSFISTHQLNTTIKRILSGS